MWNFVGRIPCNGAEVDGVLDLATVSPFPSVKLTRLY